MIYNEARKKPAIRAWLTENPDVDSRLDSLLGTKASLVRQSVIMKSAAKKKQKAVVKRVAKQ